MKFLRICSLVILMDLLTGCASKVYFTDELRTRIENAGWSVQQLQYYTDIKVTIKHELDDSVTSIDLGKVKMENGRQVEYRYLKPSTPGICDSIYSDRLSITFEGGYGQSLFFAKWPKNGNNNIPYKILALEWKRNEGSIKYNDDVYYIIPESSQAQLMIKKNVLKKIQVKKVRMKGVRIY